MIHRAGDFEEWQLADYVLKSGLVQLYAKGEVSYVPYKDLPSGEVKHVKFAWLNDQWVYVDNSQNS